MNRKRRTKTTDVVGSVEYQTAQAAALAEIAGQGRLLDPRMNPATRPHADRLLVEQHRKRLEAESTRVLRGLRVADRRAADAEKTLEVIRAARQMSSPARSVLALHKGRQRFMGLSLAASLSLSVGSAINLGHFAADHGQTGAVGYVSEIGLTVLSTISIMYRSHLGAHGKPIAKGSGQSWALWALTVVPLVAGVVANAISANVVAVFCSLGAVAFAALAHLIADQSSAALRSRADEVSDVDAAMLERVAMGEALFTTALSEQPETETDDSEEDLGEESPGLPAGQPERPELFSDEALARWLSEPPEDGAAPPQPNPDAGDGPQGSVKALPADVEQPIGPQGRIDSGQREDAHTDQTAVTFGGGVVPSKIEPAVRARRAIGDETRRRVAAYMADHPDHGPAQIATALGIHRDTAKQYRRDIRRERGER